jgi:hypothetical protein
MSADSSIEGSGQSIVRERARRALTRRPRVGHEPDPLGRLLYSLLSGLRAKFITAAVDDRLCDPPSVAANQSDMNLALALVHPDGSDIRRTVFNASPATTDMGSTEPNRRPARLSATVVGSLGSDMTSCFGFQKVNTYYRVLPPHAAADSIT